MKLNYLEIEYILCGPQGSAIVPIFFIYYLDKSLKNLTLSNGIKLQVYEDNIVFQGKTIEDLSDTYFKMKNILMWNSLIINSEKCEILTEEISDKITDEDAGIDITAKNEVKYLGQKINPEGITEQIIDDKLFGSVKN